MTETGIVFNVQRFTIHDGPGMRTEFFLKGCPLRCQWCSNPESWAPQPQIGVYRTKCIGRKVCGGCEDSCPEGDIFRFTAGKLAGIDRTKCTDCLACYEECPSDALKQWGRQMTVEECMELIRRDQGYYERSGRRRDRLGRGPAGPERFCGGPLPRLQGGGLPHLLRVHVLCQLVGGGKGSALYRPHHLGPQADGFCPPPPVYRGGQRSSFCKTSAAWHRRGGSSSSASRSSRGSTMGGRTSRPARILSSGSWAGRCEPCSF